MYPDRFENEKVNYFTRRDKNARSKNWKMETTDPEEFWRTMKGRLFRLQLSARKTYEIRKEQRDVRDIQYDFKCVKIVKD